MTDPEVTLNKKRKSEKKDVKTVVKSLRRGGINWEPTFPEGEDEHSMQQHRDMLKSEWKKRSPDMAKIKQRMELTYPDRRRMIHAQRPLAEIRSEYPALFCYSEVNTVL